KTEHECVLKLNSPPTRRIASAMRRPPPQGGRCIKPGSFTSPLVGEVAIEQSEMAGISETHSKAYVFLCVLCATVSGLGFQSRDRLGESKRDQRTGTRVITSA